MPVMYVCNAMWGHTPTQLTQNYALCVRQAHMEQHTVAQHALLARGARPLVWDNQYVATPTLAGAPLANTNIF